MPPQAWHTLVSYLFYLNKQNYITIADCFSKYPIVRKMPNITSAALVHVMSWIFAEWEPPHTMKTDNGTLYFSKVFLEFLASHKVKLITSNPHHPQSNGLAEAYVKHAKVLIIKASEAGKHSLMAYRSTLIAHNLPSPLETMTCQKLYTNLPALSAVSDKSTEYCEALMQWQERQASHYKSGP